MIRYELGKWLNGLGEKYEQMVKEGVLFKYI